MGFEAQDLIDAAYLSEIAYGEEGKSVAELLAASKWSYVGAALLSPYSAGSLTDSNFDEGGFYHKNSGQAFVALAIEDGHRTLALSFRGTQLFSDLANDLKAGIIKDWDSHWNNFQDLIPAFVAYADAIDADTILITGHSLGGAMAELYAALHGDSRNNTVTFGSPGIFDNNLMLNDRVLRIQHSGDPVASALSETGFGRELIVNLPDNPDLHIIDLSIHALRGFIGEHAMSLYRDTANFLAPSSLGTELFSNPEQYQVSFSQSGGALRSSSTRQQFLLGGNGNDQIYGNSADDLLEGGFGRDELNGNGGNDLLSGGQGNDVLAGGRGKDALIGNEGADRFNVNNSFYYNELFVDGLIDDIVDYNRGNTGDYEEAEGDKIDISGFIRSAYISMANADVSSFVRAFKDPVTGFLMLQVDRDGSDNGDRWVTVAQLRDLPEDATISLILDPANSEAVAQISITDVFVDPPASWLISPATRNVEESGGSVIFTVSRPSIQTAQTVYISTTFNRGALNDNDYAGWLNIPVTFPIGVQTSPVTILINDDNKAEIPETFGVIVQSSPDQPASEYLAAATFTIHDNDATAPGGVFTEADDEVWITPEAGSVGFVDPGGRDRLTVDFSAFDKPVEFFRNSNQITTHIQTIDGSHTIAVLGVEDFTILGGSGNDNLEARDDGSHVLIGGAGNDTIQGANGNDVLSGGEGGDALYAKGGIDVLDGGAGDDYIDVGEGGADAIDGGDGIDTLVLRRSDLTDDVSFVFDPKASGSFTLPDGTVVTGVERLHIDTGSGDDNVTLVADPLMGGNHGVRDTGGRDRLTVDFSAFDKPVEFFRNSNQITTHIQTIDGSHTIAVLGVEDFTILGGSGNDNLEARDDGSHVLIGGAGNDTTQGANGNDVLSGGQGGDALYAKGGIDVLDGGAGDDYIDVGEGGADAIDGGDGIDTLVLRRSDLTDDVSFVFDPKASGSFTLPDGTVVTGVERLHIDTGSGDDNVTLVADPLMGGNHGVRDTGGRDRLTVDFSAFDKPVEFFRNSNQITTHIQTIDGSHTIAVLGVEDFTILGGSGNDNLEARDDGSHVLIGGAGNDTIQGANGNDVLSGGEGGDALYAKGGIDVLDGGAGDDYIDVGEGGADAIDGGDGIDTLVLRRSDLTDDVSFVFDPKASGSFTLPDGTVVTGVERLHIDTGSGDDNVTLVADPLMGGNHGVRDTGGRDRLTVDFSAFDKPVEFFRNSNQITTHIQTIDGSHTIAVLGVEDFTILGGSGNDNLEARDDGSHVLIGGAGNDTIQGANGNDVLSGGEGGDALYAKGGIDVLDGGAGDDYIDVGEGGADAIDGGDGIDTLVLRRSDLTDDVSFVFDPKASGSFTLPDGTVVTGVERLHIDTGSGDDNVTLVADPLMGGNHGVRDTGGRDRLTVDFSAFDKPVEFFRNSNQITTHIQTIDGSHTIAVLGVEDFTILGGSGNDNLEARDDGSHVLIGGAGNDTIQGANGNDVLSGGQGDDILIAGDGIDVLDGGAGDDYLQGGSGSDTFSFFAKTDSRVSGTDTIVDFASGTDVISLSGIAGISYDAIPFIFNNDIETTVAAIVADNFLNNALVYFTDGSEGYLYVKGTGTGIDFDGTLIALRGMTMPLSYDDLEGIVMPSINVAPTLTGDLVSVVNEGRDIVIATADLGFADLDDDATGIKFSVTDLTNGTVRLNSIDTSSFTGAQLAAGEVSFVHDGSETNTASFNISVEDGDEDRSESLIATFRLTVTPVNDAPAISGPVTLAASDENAVRIITAAELLANASDTDNDNLSVANLQASSGELFPNNDGSWTFRPAPNDDTSVSLSYGVSDGIALPVVTTAIFDLRRVDDSPIYGDDGDDQLRGGNASDTLVGKNGNDLLSGGNGNDMAEGGEGNDVILGGNGNDELYGGAGDDNFNGGNGNDLIVGGGDNDILLGGNGNDELTGGDGDDALIGGNGADILNGGAGDDKFSGGNGPDTFVFQPSFGNDTIEDFRTIGSQHDELQFDISLFADETHLFGSSADTVDGVLITANAGDTLLIKNTTVAALQAHPEDLYFV